MALLFSKQYETRVQMVKHSIISAGSSWFGVLKYFNLAIHPSAVDCILHLLYGALQALPNNNISQFASRACIL